MIAFLLNWQILMHFCMVELMEMAYIDMKFYKQFLSNLLIKGQIINYRILLQMVINVQAIIVAELMFYLVIVGYH